tara:strand:- start:1222 stop:1521 length:300 start_codon:yes stop_codon:yes gene_type:complete
MPDSKEIREPNGSSDGRGTAGRGDNEKDRNDNEAALIFHLLDVSITENSCFEFPCEATGDAQRLTNQAAVVVMMSRTVLMVIRYIRFRGRFVIVMMAAV